MYSNVRFDKKNNEQHEIHFLVHFRGLKRVNALGENSNTTILLRFTESQDLYSRMYTNLIIGNWEKYRITYFKC